ncbi:DMT family transporter [Nocardia salmonicida]|uniref:DMT family transporter n=1 Tax=Nocardia salmonicida TaxID=53431 RepID=UPI0037A4AA7F
MTWLLLAAAILSEVAASLSLKGSETDPALYAVVVVGYVAAFVFLAAVLKRGLALGVAYGIWGASGVALTAVLSSLLFDEAFTLAMGAGLALVIAGVLLVETGSHPAEAAATETSR